MSTPPSVAAPISRVGLWRAAALIAIAVLPVGSAHAQSASGTLSSFRTGYGGAGLTGLEAPVSPSLISSSSQFALSDGVNQAGSTGSVFTTQTQGSQSSGGAGQSYTGVGQAAVSNERAPLAVVESASTNAAGAHAATTGGPSQSDMVLNGKLNLDGGQ